MELTFHIVYTAGTVRQLTSFLPSLLRWSTCSFRLVANGCQAAEIQTLRALCRHNPRLDLLILPTVQGLLHGMVLNYLQARSSEPYFCFMDSDIFATGPFLPTLTNALAQATTIFSCPPLGCVATDQLLAAEDPLVQGIINHTADGLCLGGTYLAIYARPQLAELISTTGIGFETRYWTEISAVQQDILAALGVQRTWYDTGKVLNLLLLHQGARLDWCDTPALHHLGGISLAERYQRNPKRHIKTFILHLLQRVQGKRNREKELLDGIWTGTGRGRLAQVRRREIAYSLYFCTLLTALERHQPLPPLPTAPDLAAQQRLLAATQALSAAGVYRTR